MPGFKPTNTSSPAKPLVVAQRPLVSIQATISDVSRGSAASKSELHNLTPAEVEFFDAVVKRIPPNATSFLSGLKAYNDELHDRGWDSQTETVHYGRLLELCKLRGPSWNHKWEGVKQQHGYSGPSRIPIPTMSAKAPIPISKPARSTARLATPVRDEDDDVFTLHSHQDQEHDGTATETETETETPCSDAESDRAPPRPLTRLNQATRPNASVQLTRVTRTPASRPSNNILPPALTRVSTPRPQTAAGHHQPTVWEGMSDITDDGDVPGSLSTTPPSYRAAVATPVPQKTRGQPTVRASSPIKNPVAVSAIESTKGRARKGSVINEDEAWQKIKMSRDEEDADKFREDKLLEHCWGVWVLGYQWLAVGIFEL
jgi:protein SFI1